MQRRRRTRPRSRPAPGTALAPGTETGTAPAPALATRPHLKTKEPVSQSSTDPSGVEYENARIAVTLPFEADLERALAAQPTSSQGQRSLTTTLTYSTETSFEALLKIEPSITPPDLPQSQRWVGVSRLFVSALNLGYDRVFDHVKGNAKTKDPLRVDPTRGVRVSGIGVTFNATTKPVTIGDKIVGPVLDSFSTIPIAVVATAPTRISDLGLVQQALDSAIVRLERDDLYFAGQGYATKLNAVAIDAAQLPHAYVGTAGDAWTAVFPATDSDLVLKSVQYAPGTVETATDAPTLGGAIEARLADSYSFGSTLDYWTVQSVKEWLERSADATGKVDLNPVVRTPLWGMLEIQVPASALNALLALSEEDSSGDALAASLNISVQLEVSIPVLPDA